MIIYSLISFQLSVFLVQVSLFLEYSESSCEEQQSIYSQQVSILLMTQIFVCYSLFSIFLLKKKKKRCHCRKSHKTICPFSYVFLFLKKKKPKTCLFFFFKHTLKVIFVIAVAILPGFFIIFQLVTNKMIVSNIFLMIKYMIIDDRLIIFNIILCIQLKIYIFHSFMHICNCVYGIYSMYVYV